MSLYTDNDCITIADLQAVDAECADVASSQTPPIGLEGERSVIRRAMERCGSKIISVSQTMTGYYISSGLGLNHIMAVMNVGGFGIERPRLMLNQLVTLDPNPTKRQYRIWLENSALAYLYRDAYARFGKQGDRFAAKHEMYQSEADGAWAQLASCGFPIILTGYLACPGAIREFNAGTWDQTCLSVGGSGSTETGTSYDVAITWVGSPYVSPTNKGNAESAPSAIASTPTAAGQVITVNITALNPPAVTAPAIGLADGAMLQMAATGWNVYIGPSGGILRLQNVTPIAIGTKSYTLANKPTTTGATADLGQYSTTNLAFAPLFKRG